MKPTLLILAAGMGSRYGGLKQLDAFGPHGESIIDYSVYDAIRAGFGKIVFIIRESFKADFLNLFHDKLSGKIDYVLVCQDLDDLPTGFTCPPGREKPWGTGHAVWVAREHITGSFGVINADDYYGKSAMFDLCNFLKTIDNSSGINGVVAYYLKNTLSEYGAVNRGLCFSEDHNNLKHVQEVKGISSDKDSIFYMEGDKRISLQADTLVSMNMWAFTEDYFGFAESYFTQFLKQHIHEEKSEFYIPELVQELIDKNIKQFRIIPSSSTWFGVTYIEDKDHVKQKLMELIDHQVYPLQLWEQ